MTTLAQAAEQMLAAGMPGFPDGLPIADGRIHRYGKKKRAWYRLREFPRRNGSGTFVAGHFGIWGQIDRTKIVADFSGIDDAERDRLRSMWAEREQTEKQKRERRALDAARRASAQWKAARSALPQGVRCPYLERKGIEHENGAFRYLVDGELATLVVPMVRYDVDADPQDDASSAPRRVVGLQKILPDGTKRFNKGTNPVGASVLLGKPPKDGSAIVFVEGVATGASVRMATDRQYPVVVCFTAGNLLAVAQLYRKLYPKSPFLFAADDDAYLYAQLNNRLRGDFDLHELFLVSAPGDACIGAEIAGGVDMLVEIKEVEDERGVKGLAGVIVRGDRRFPVGISNAGRTKANEAAEAVGNAWVCYPHFQAVVVDLKGQRQLSPDPAAERATDFNDLHKAEGLEPVRKQLLEAIALITVPAKADAAAREAERKQRDEERRRRQAEKERQEEFDQARLRELLDRYILIYPTTDAYDCETEEIVKLEHVSARYGSKYVAGFTTSQRKRVVHLENVVFDPRGEVDQLDQGRINLFRGIEMEPNPAGSCEKLKELLFYLCNDDLEVYRWVMRWLALPLQKLGSKMSTSLVLHGEQEGTGKNLFFGAIAEIYGRHGGFITQRQLESDFNDWQSAKLFMVANEVVTRAEMRHQAGYIRHLITEPKIWINKKQISAREEANHMNLVFLSNENQPLLVPRHDRRFVVIRTPDKLPKERYTAIVDELRAGGAAALFHHLRHEIELGDFHTHTEPIETAAKRELIEIGLGSPQLFWQDLHEGEFPLPYSPCLREDLFRAYLSWCARNAEKMPKRINQFMPEFRSMNGVRFDRRRVKLNGIPRQRRIVIMGAPPDHIENEDDWIEAAVQDFAAKLEDMQRGGNQ
jgi:putative DNA primase/helicase